MSTLPKVMPRPRYDRVPISIINAHRDWYKINREYQREDDVWTHQDKKYLIDSILRNVDIPKIYVRELPDNTFEIVDGQQRISTIWDFIDGEFALDGTISGGVLDGKKYTELPPNLVKHFDSYALDLIILKGYNDDMIRETFSRLQRGRPLNPAERLNAFPGTIVPVMRAIGNHNFFNKVNFHLGRYRAYLIVARMLLLENTGGPTDIAPYELYDFFHRYKNINHSSPVSRNVLKVMNYIDVVFPEKTPELNNDAWVINIYVLVSDLLKKYVMRGREKDMHDFFTKFWQEAEGLRRANRKPTAYEISQDFILANTSGTTGKSNIETRFRVMKTNFLTQHPNLELLDVSRFFDYYEKVVIYRRDNGRCKWPGCGIKVAWNEYEADHVRSWSAGGKTTIEQGQVLCRTHNRAKGAR